MKGLRCLQTLAIFTLCYSNLYIEAARCDFPAYSNQVTPCHPGSCCRGFVCVDGECENVDLHVSTTTGEQSTPRAGDFAVASYITVENVAASINQLKQKYNSVVSALLTLESSLESNTKSAEDVTSSNVPYKREQLLSTHLESRKPIVEKLYASMTQVNKESMINTQQSYNSLLEKSAEPYLLYETYSQYVPGYIGSPCGKTRYKEFGECTGDLECVPPRKEALPYAPGSCQTKAKDGDNDRRGLENVSDDDKSFTNHTFLLFGEKGGPCGKTFYMDFGPCKTGLICSSPMTNISLTPGICGKDHSGKNNTSNKNVPRQRQGSRADFHAAQKANKLALATADTAEEIAKQLLAAAAELRNAAKSFSNYSSKEPLPSHLVNENPDRISLEERSEVALRVLYLFVSVLLGGCLCRCCCRHSGYERI
mmetsp:Transcript_8300/g.10804  ORF Transcript_8300/g.10804 Transcript_8300/m.10804 type:complete len:424 (+) Transcript_8300:141-1412(+)